MRLLTCFKVKKAIVISAVLAFSAGLWGGPGQGWSLDRDLLKDAGMDEIGAEAPDFTLKAPSGKRLTLRENRGRVVVIHVWATWCKPCKDEFPQFEKMHRAFKDNGVVFFPVAIDKNAGAKELGAFAKGLGATFDVYAAGEGDITDKYWGMGVPVTYLVDKKGFIAARAIGPRDWGGEAFSSLIRALLNE